MSDRDALVREARSWARFERDQAVIEKPSIHIYRADQLDDFADAIFAGHTCPPGQLVVMFDGHRTAMRCGECNLILGYGPQVIIPTNTRLEIVLHTLRSMAQDFEDQYEKLTREHGAYGQTKVRAAYRLASVLIRKRADETERE